MFSLSEQSPNECSSLHTVYISIRQGTLCTVATVFVVHGITDMDLELCVGMKSAATQQGMGGVVVAPPSKLLNDSSFERVAPNDRRI